MCTQKTHQERKQLSVNKNQEHKLVHSNPATSRKMVIINKSNGDILNDNHIERMTGKNLDRYEILQQIAHDQKMPTSSYWKELVLLPPGFTYTHRTRFKESEIELNLLEKPTDYPSESEDPIEILLCSIVRELQQNRNKKIVIRFSGGVDSTCLLLAVLEVADVDRITALTWIDDNCSSNNDQIFATELCNKLNIRQLFFKFDPYYFFQPIDPYKHLFINPGMAADPIFEQEHIFLSHNIDDEYIVLDGHGGDHLFLDPVPSAAFLYPIRNKKIIGGLKIATIISRLTGSSIYETLFRDRRQHAYETRERREFLNWQSLPPLNYKKPESLAEEHLHAITQAIYQNTLSAFPAKTSNIAYPFTSEEMVAYALKQDPYRMFNALQTRLPLKQSITKRHPDIIPRSDKGHITSAYQKALGFHREKILKTLKHSWLRKESLINIQNVEKAINRSALGIGGVEQTLLKIICTSLLREH